MCEEWKAENVIMQGITVGEISSCFDGFSMVCPKCDSEYNHVSGVEHDMSSNRTKYGVWEILVDCECGCKWKICIGDHKGELLLWTEHTKLSKKEILDEMLDNTIVDILNRLTTIEKDLK